VIAYCNQCAAPVEHIIPQGDSLKRAYCPNCRHIQYENPRLIVGCIAEFEEKILLCRRAIEPRHGFWTLPAGFMENGETTIDGAKREALEEACASIDIDAPFALISIAHINQVHLFYRGHMRTPEFSAGEESLEVKLLAFEEIPWDELAFKSVRYCLEKYREDKKSGMFHFHETTLA
jgi:ADP-ribose pyrophosphatase YjhB (NUDIX family)